MSSIQTKKAKIVGWLASFFGVFGALLLASDTPVSGYAYYLWMFSNFLWIEHSALTKIWANGTQQFIFALINFLGVFNYLGFEHFLILCVISFIYSIFIIYQLYFNRLKNTVAHEKTVEQPDKAKKISWIASVLGISAGILLALDLEISGYAYYLFMLSSYLWIEHAAITKVWSNGAQQLIYLIIGFFGVFNYLGVLHFVGQVVISLLYGLFIYYQIKINKSNNNNDVLTELT